MADVKITTNAKELEARMVRRAALFAKQVEAAERRNLEDMKKEAVSLSSGAAPSPDPSRPYARRAPHPKLPPFIVNVQKGVFRRSWQTSLTNTAGNLVGRLFNTAFYSRFFDGNPTRHMIARPILQAVIERSRKNVFQRVVGAVRSALKVP